MIITGKESEIVGILGGRQNFHGLFDLGVWTDLRLGMFWNFVDIINDADTNGETEYVHIDDVTDHLTIGLKDANPLIHPGEADSLFFGVRGYINPPFNAFTVIRNYNPGQGRVITDVAGIDRKMLAYGYAGITEIDGGQIRSGRFSDGAIYTERPSDTNSFNGFFSIRFVLNHSGAANQSVDISTACFSLVDGPDYSPQALRTVINQADYGPAKNIPWNTGISARALPTAVWLRFPFYQNRVKLNTIRLVKYA